MPTTMLHVGEHYRYARPRMPSEQKLDGLSNFFYVTRCAHAQRMAQLEAGINPIKIVGREAARRQPALLLRSSPLKAGSLETPWHDVFDVEAGRGIYFGDHKAATNVPFGQTPGNKAMAEAWPLHGSSSYVDRLAAPPLLLFRGVSRTRSTGAVERKGAVAFLGLARISNATSITAADSAGSYPNMMFELEFTPLDDPARSFDWAWINLRRDPNVDLEKTLELAPRAWAYWVRNGT